MKKAITLTILSLFTLVAHAQHFDWVKTYAGNIEYTKIVSSVTDNAGNLYILGCFSQESRIDGVNLCPIATDKQCVLIAKITPSGEMVWYKPICSSGSHSYAYDIRMLDDSSLMVMVSLALPYDNGYGESNNLYYLDTLLTGNDDYLMPTNSIASNMYNAFIAFNFDGNVIEQHFVGVGYIDTLGNTLTPNYIGANNSERMYARMLSGQTFNVDSEGNIYVIRATNDYWSALGRLWIINDGTLAALNIMVDGNRSLTYNIPRPTATWNQQILKFSPHFDSIIGDVYIFDSTLNHSGFPTISVSSLDIDDQTNLYVCMGGSQLPSELNLSNSNDLHLTTNTVTSSWLVKYSADLFATHLIKLSHTGETTNLAQSLGIYNTHVDESTNSLFIMGTLKWAANPQYTEGYVLYNGDTVNVDNKSAYWIRLNKDNLALISFGKARSNEETYGITALATSHNRVFSQIKYKGSINFDDTTCVVDNHGMAFVIWDNEGHELEIIDYGNVASQDYAGQINVVDSIVYLTGIISNGQCFGSSTETWEGSQPYISKYVDISFESPYDNRETQLLEWQQELSFSISDNSIVLTASSTSGLPVSYICSDTNIARIEGQTLHLLTEGEALVTASQEGNSQFLPAEPITKTLRIANNGIEEVHSEPIVIYPNPAKDAVYYSFNKKIQKIQVLSSTGNPVEFTFTNNKVDISQLPAGVFFLLFVTENNIYRYKIIKS